MEGDGRAREREGGHLLALPAERPCWDRPVRALTRELCQAAEQEQLLCRDHIESLSSLGLLCDSEAVLSSEEQSSKLLELRLPSLAEAAEFLGIPRNTQLFCKAISIYIK